LKFLFTADLHLSAYSQDRIVDGLPERLYYLMTVLHNMAEHAIDNGIDVFVIAGDVFHTKSIIHALAQSLLLDFLNKYNDRIHFIIIDGNHDVSSKSGTGVSGLKCLDSVRNVAMVHDEAFIENIYFVAWNDKTFNRIKNGKDDYLVAHFGLNEAELNSGISIVSDLGLNDIKQYKTALLGHYHKPQEVGNVVYVGSPIQLDWGEKNEEKRFLIVDTVAHTIDSIPTEGYKKHFDFELTKESKDEVIKMAKKLKEEGHEIKITLKEDGVDIDELSGEFRVIDKREKDITNRGIDSSMSKEDIIDKFLIIREIPDDDLKDYKDVALRIINDCTEEQHGKS